MADVGGCVPHFDLGFTPNVPLSLEDSDDEPDLGTLECMAWTVPQYTRTQVSNAGRDYVNPAMSPEQREIALAVINNWRSSHAFPLNTMQMRLRKTAVRFDPDFLVAQRIKRLPSIVHKLTRMHGMELARMQDIGGCRAVVSDVEAVDAITKYYLSPNNLRHQLKRHDDYLRGNVRADGYRGVHLVYSYNSDRKATYNKLQIEIQLRTRLQHAWATAVETVDTFTGQALKSKMGDKDWHRFFSLVSSDFAYREGTPLVPGTPADRKALRAEIRKLARQLDVILRLRAYGSTLQLLEQQTGKTAKYFLLELFVREGNSTLQLRVFDNPVHATDAYQAIEAADSGVPGRDVVLVSVDSITSLRRAYPNYFADTEAFVTAVEEAMAS